MANTYTQIHIETIIAVKFRASIIHTSWKEKLHKYITGILQNNSHKMVAINSLPDHLHLLFELHPTQSLADLMRIIKGGSYEWINENKFNDSTFRWQTGYGAFSYCRSQLEAITMHIENQENYHTKISFPEEYEQLLALFKIDYDQQKLFKPLE